MIYIYNETNTPWAYSKLTDKYSRFTVAKKVDESKTRYMNLSSTVMPIENIESYVNMDSVDTLYTGTIGLMFQKRDCSPMLTTTTKFSKDIVLMNLNLKGSVIKAINSDTMNVINYMIAKGELSLVLSGEETGNNNVEIVLHNDKEKLTTTYKFTKEGGHYLVEVIVEETGETLAAPNFKIHKFRPNRPTHAIVVHESDDEYFENAQPVPVDRHVIYHYRDTNVDDIIGLLKKDKYNAVTLFVNKSELENNEQIKNFTAFKKAFAVVNILLNTKKVIKK